MKKIELEGIIDMWRVFQTIDVPHHIPDTLSLIGEFYDGNFEIDCMFPMTGEKRIKQFVDFQELFLNKKPIKVKITITEEE